MITAKIIKDSCNSFGKRITTMELVYPRIIHSELMTHRLFSRNSASSRAIPFKKMVKEVQDNPFIPIAWQKDHKGMQGSEYENNQNEIDLNINDWINARNNAINVATRLNKKGNVTKQLCNRLLEPFMWHKVLITFTEIENFFKLRCPQYSIITSETFRSKKDLIKDLMNVNVGLDTTLSWLHINKGQSEIHMMALAEAMWDAYNESVPEKLKQGEWHVPYEDQIKKDLFEFNKNIVLSYKDEDIRKISVAMCARVSYTTIGEGEKEFNYDNNIKLHDSLIASGHWSPLEHIAKTMNNEEYFSFIKSNGEGIKITLNGKDIYSQKSFGWCNNFRGFIQYRYLIENKNE